MLFVLLAMSGCGEKTGTAAAGAAAKKGEPAIRWRLQSYAGPALNPWVCGDAIKEFNIAANGEMVIDVYTADELVPQGEMFQAVQKGTIDACVSDDDSMASPVDVAVFGAYFPFASRYGLDVDVLWNWYGLNDIWKEAYDEIQGVTWLSQGSWDPCNFATHQADAPPLGPQGPQDVHVPDGRQVHAAFGVVPVSMPYEDVEMAIQTGMLDGVCWSGITEDYTVGWADVCKYYLTNPISGGWAGGWFVNTKAWEKVPAHLQQLFKLTIEKSHYLRLHWYWWGEAQLPGQGRQDAAHDHPRERVGAGREGGPEVLGRVCSQERPGTPRWCRSSRTTTTLMYKAGPPYRY